MARPPGAVDEQLSVGIGHKTLPWCLVLVGAHGTCRTLPGQVFSSSASSTGLTRLRSPDAAQRVALAKRCAAEPGPYKARCSLRSRFCEAALREGLRAASRP